LITLIAGTLIAISASSWLSTWIGLEINLLSLIPLIKSHNNKYSAESTIKYFITQTIASTIFLFSVIILIYFHNIQLKIPGSILITTALLIKLGAAPFHFWLPEVIRGLNWEIIYIILTWQKIAPIILLSYTSYIPIFLSIIIILSSLIRGLQGLNQTCLRKIIAYSSINHVGWMLSRIFTSLRIWFLYFFIYCIINLNILLIFNKYNLFYFTQLTKIFSFNKKLKLIFILNFLSLGGLPPFLGFLPKWIIINFLTNNNFYTLATIITITTLISLYFYLRLTFSRFSLNTQESLIKTFYKLHYFYFYLNTLTLIGLILCSLVTNTH